MGIGLAETDQRWRRVLVLVDNVSALFQKRTFTDELETLKKGGSTIAWGIQSC